jgi:hypothetical protein
MARRTRKLFQRERHQLEEPTLAQPIILAKLQRPDHRNSKKVSHRDYRERPQDDRAAARAGASLPGGDGARRAYPDTA